MAVTATQVQNLYLAYFGRPAEQAGLTYWTAQANATVEQISASFAQQPEYATAFSGLTRSQVVNQLYTNLFGRTAASNELSYWVNSTDVSVDKLALALTNGATGTDRLTLDNKVQFATTVTTSAGASATQQQVTTAFNDANVVVTGAGAGTYDTVAAYVAAVATATSGISAAQAAAQFYAQANTNLQAILSPSVAAADTGVTADFKGQTAGTIKLNGAAGADALVVGTVASGTGVSKVTDLTLSGSISAASTATVSEAATTKAITGLTVNVSSTGTATADKVLGLNLTDLTALKTLDASGSTAGINTDVTSLSSLTSVKTGSGADNVSVDTLVAAANVGKAVALTVDTGAGNDTITATIGHAALSINAGAGNDTVVLNATAPATAATLAHTTSITLGDGADTLQVASLGNLVGTFSTADATSIATANTAYADNAIKVSDFSAQDTLNIAGVLTGTGAAGSLVTLTTTQLSNIAGAASLAEAVQAAATAAAGTTPASHSAVFQYGGNTYVFADHTTAATVTAGDGLIELTGFTGQLSASNFVTA